MDKKVYVLTATVTSRRAANTVAAAVRRAGGVLGEMTITVNDTTATRADPRDARLEDVLGLKPESAKRLAQLGLATFRDVTKLSAVEVWRLFNYQRQHFTDTAGYMVEHNLQFADDVSPLSITKGMDTLANRPALFLTELVGSDINPGLRVALGMAGVLCYELLRTLEVSDVENIPKINAHDAFSINAARGALAPGKVQR